MSSRSERHREMAEAALRAHQGLTEAHLGGREPEPAPEQKPARSVAFYTPQLGESELDRTPMSGGEMSLRELEMYWKRIPDFGIKDYEIFPSEAGWAQVLYWRGTGEDGQEYLAEEVDIVRTDDDFNVTRFEIYSDAAQWMELVAYANDTTAAELRRSSGSYGDLMAES